MANEHDLDKALKRAYQTHKRQNPLSRHALENIKSKCRKPKNSQFWQQMQWATACVGLLFLSVLLFKPEPDMTNLYTLDLSQFDHIAHHSKKGGQYTVEITQSDSELLKAKHSELLRHARAFHGRVLENNSDYLLIADCKTNTLIEIEQSIVHELTGISFDKPINQGDMLALTSDKNGLLVDLTAQNSRFNQYHCK